MALRIVTADQRIAEASGVKAVIFGPAKIGKTTLLRTLDAASTLFLDVEAGDLAVEGVAVAAIRPETERWSWPDLRDVAALLGGPNPALAPDRPYSSAHYDFVVARDGAMDLAPFRTIFVDSITVASRLCFAWCMTQPDAFNKQGMPDTRGAYGLLGREMTGWLTQLQHSKGRNVIFVGILDKATDDFGRTTWEPQIEGRATGAALLGIVDQVVTLQMVPFESTRDGQPVTELVRCFVTQQSNPYGYPAGDRSGRLDPLEPPDLGKLIDKASNAERRRAEIVTTFGDHQAA